MKISLLAWIMVTNKEPEPIEAFQLVRVESAPGGRDVLGLIVELLR